MNDSMEDACDIRVNVLPSELLYDDINMCRTKMVTRTEYFLQDAMSLVGTDDSETFSIENDDVCCQAFGNGQDSLQEAC